MTPRSDRPGPDRGSSFISYAAVLTLSAGIVLAVLGADLPEATSDLMSDAICAVGSEEDCDDSGPALPEEDDDGVPVELTISVAADSESPAKVWTLTCSPAGGSHPDPEGACAALEAADHTVPDPVPDGELCTTLHGGTNTATISGTIDGTEISEDFNRIGGCEISRWEDMDALLTP